LLYLLYQVLGIALLCFVDHNSITNYGGNSKTCQDDSIVLLITNLVFISCTKNVDICNSANANYRLGGTWLHAMTLDCIRKHSATFQGIRLHSKAFGSIPRDLTSTRIDWAWRAHMSQQIGKVDSGLALQSTKNTEWNKGCR
jgi:hypothetical protein